MCFSKLYLNLWPVLYLFHDIAHHQFAKAEKHKFRYYNEKYFRLTFLLFSELMKVYSHYEKYLPFSTFLMEKTVAIFRDDCT